MSVMNQTTNNTIYGVGFLVTFLIFCIIYYWKLINSAKNVSKETEATKETIFTVDILIQIMMFLSIIGVFFNFKPKNMEQGMTQNNKEIRFWALWFLTLSVSIVNMYLLFNFKERITNHLNSELLNFKLYYTIVFVVIISMFAYFVKFNKLTNIPKNLLLTSLLLLLCIFTRLIYWELEYFITDG